MSQSGYLPVSGGHCIYYETRGSPHSPAIVVLHGGPGGAMQPELWPLFQGWYTIMFDQRGCGKSEPFGELQANRTTDLVSDIEALRIALGVEQWSIFGGSWGTTLGLAYALSYPKQVRALIFRGTCLCGEDSYRWLYERGGASEVRPEAWAHFIAGVPSHIVGAGWRALLQWYHGRIAKGGAVGQRAAEAWWRWEWAVSRMLPSQGNGGITGKNAVAIALLETHYFLHQCWLPHLLQRIRRSRLIRRIPLTMIHGRYDLVCPLSGAEEVKKVLPHARLVIVPDAGHAAEDMMPVLRSEIRRMRMRMRTRRATRKRTAV